MARNGFRIFDSETHVGLYFDVQRYLNDAEKSKLPAREQYKTSTARGYAIYASGKCHYRRGLGAVDLQDTRAFDRVCYLHRHAASRAGRPYPVPEVGPEGEGLERQRALEERYFSAAMRAKHGRGPEQR